MGEIRMSREGLTALAIAAVLLAPRLVAADEVGGDEVIVADEAPPPPTETVPEPAKRPYGRRGPYLGIGPSIFFPQFSGGAARFGTTGGLTARVGWRFLDYVALEALYEWSQYSRSELGGNGTLTSHVGALDLRLIYPLGRFQPYVGGGPGLMSMSKFVGGFYEDLDLNIGTELAWRVTGGFDLFLSEGWSAFAEGSWVRPTSKLDQYEYVTAGIGLKYTFGGESD